MKKLLLFTITILALSACRKERSGQTRRSDIDNISVPTGFTWENSRDVTFDVGITNALFPEAIYVVSVYDRDPAKGGKLLSKGSATIAAHFQSTVYLNNNIREVYIMKTAPDNSFTSQTVAVTASRIDVSMSAGQSQKQPDKVKGIEDSPDCTTGCNATITSSNSNVVVASNTTTCVTGSNITIGVTVRSGGTLRICGKNVTVSSTSIESNAGIVVTSSGTVTFNSLNVNSATEFFKNYGTSTVNLAIAPTGILLNENVLNVAGNVDLAAGSKLDNNGLLNITGDLEIFTSNAITNNGSIITSANFITNTGTNFTNNCTIWAKGGFSQKGVFKNYNLVRVNGGSVVNFATELSMYNGAMLTTASLTNAGVIKGYGPTSIVKVSGNSLISLGASVQGTLQYCDANGIELNLGSIGSGATLACDVYIPVTNCNSVGNGTAPVVDSDGDGVSDQLDEYPADATKAYNNYYPSSAERATVVFEDQWPIKGDYDLNDIVMSYRYKVVTNASNKVVQVTGDFSLRASGTGYNEGFGVEFPLARTAVSNVTGGTLETGQNNAVIILFNDARQEQQLWNTRSTDKPVSPAIDYSVTFNVNSAPALSAFGLSSYNPFIWNGSNGAGRSYEIHLPGKTPTTLANQALFGTGDDNSSTTLSRYYLTKTGLPWAINIPVTTFSYPTEETEITQAYLKFKEWAESNGTLLTDWYSNTGTGYRDASKLFQ